MVKCTICGNNDVECVVIRDNVKYYMCKNINCMKDFAIVNVNGDENGKDQTFKRKNID